MNYFCSVNTKNLVFIDPFKPSVEFHIETNHAQQIKWPVSKWNAALGWNGVSINIEKVFRTSFWMYFVEGCILLSKGPSIKYVRKIFYKTNISNPLIRTRTYAYQGVGNVSFSKNFAYL